MTSLVTLSCVYVAMGITTTKTNFESKEFLLDTRIPLVYFKPQDDPLLTADCLALAGLCSLICRGGRLSSWQPLGTNN